VVEDDLHVYEEGWTVDGQVFWTLCRFSGVHYHHWALVWINGSSVRPEKYVRLFLPHALIPVPRLIRLECAASRVMAIV
jgi:hypothetical protein